MQYLLLSHILGAFSTFILILLSVLNFKKYTQINIQFLSKSLFVNTIFQVATGSFLLFQNYHQGELMLTCSKLGVYLFFVMTTQFMLFTSAKKHSENLTFLTFLLR
jgi:hypothetical protein